MLNHMTVDLEGEKRRVVIFAILATVTLKISQ